jgi:protein TonB
MNRPSSRESEWRRDYPIHLAAGAVLSLSFVLVAFSLSIYRSTPEATAPPPPEGVTMVDLPSPTANATPPPPPAPLVPQEVPNDVIIGSETPIPLDDDLIIDYGKKAEAGSDLPPLPSSNEGEAEREPFRVVEVMPKLKGGMKALYENVTYPRRAQQAGIDGRVILQFTVAPDGSIHDIEAMGDAHPLLERAAIDALKKMTFEPGRQRSRTVPVRITIPVTFSLD